MRLGSQLLAAVIGSLIAMVASADMTTGPDFSTLQNQFEQRAISRVQFALDPILGTGQYSLSLKLNVDTSSLTKTNAYFPKLGLSAPILPRSIDFRFEELVRGLDLQIAYASSLNVDQENVKSKAEAAMTALGKFKTTVDVSEFKPTSTKWFAGKTEWTPLAMFLCTIILALAMLSTGRLMSQLKIQVQAPAAATNNSAIDSRANVEMAETTKSHIDPATSLLRSEGATKWRELVDEDPEQARLFIEGIVRKGHDGHRGLLNYIFAVTEIKRSKSILKHLNKESIEVIRESSSEELDNAEIDHLDHQLLKGLTVHFLDEHLDAENLLKQIHDFNIDDCVEAIKFDPKALVLFVRYFSTPHLEQILSKLPADNLEMGLSALNLGANQNQNYSGLAQNIRNHIVSKRSQQSSKNNDQNAKILQVARGLDREREKVFYQSMLESGKVDDILINGNECFPQFLIPELPGEVLKVVLNSYSLPDRAKIIYSFDPEFKNKLVQSYAAEPRAAEALQVEFEIIEKDLMSQMNTLQKQAALHTEYFGRVRKYILTSPKHILSATEILKKWVSIGGKRDTRLAG